MKRVWIAILVASLLIFLLILPLSDFFSFYFVILGYGYVTITVFFLLLILTISLPFWYCGFCCVIGVKNRKFKDNCFGPKWSWRDCWSSCFMNGWVCFFFLVFFVFLYMTFMLMSWAPSTNADYFRLHVLSDTEDSALPDAIDDHDYVYHWLAGYVVNSTAGRHVETKTPGPPLYCVYPVLDSANVDMNSTDSLIVHVIVGCTHSSEANENGTPFTCYDVREDDGHVPECFFNVDQGNLAGLVSVNRLNYLWNRYDGPWERAMEDLKLHWNETHTRSMQFDENYVVVNLMTEDQFDEFKHEAKIDFIVLFLFIHVTILCCLFCWCGCYWIVTQICRTEWFDDELFVRYDEEGHTLLRRTGYGTQPLTAEQKEQNTRIEGYRQERETRKKETTSSVRRGNYDLLEGDESTFQL